MYYFSQIFVSVIFWRILTTIHIPINDTEQSNPNFAKVVSFSRVNEMSKGEKQLSPTFCYQIFGRPVMKFLGINTVNVLVFSTLGHLEYITETDFQLQMRDVYKISLVTLYLFLPGNISMNMKSYQGEFLIKNSDILRTCRFFQCNHSVLFKCLYCEISIDFNAWLCIKHEAVNSGGRGGEWQNRFLFVLRLVDKCSLNTQQS